MPSPYVVIRKPGGVSAPIPTPTRAPIPAPVRAPTPVRAPAPIARTQASTSAPASPVPPSVSAPVSNGGRPENAPIDGGASLPSAPMAGLNAAAGVQPAPQPIMPDAYSAEQNTDANPLRQGLGTRQPPSLQGLLQGMRY